MPRFLSRLEFYVRLQPRLAGLKHMCRQISKFVLIFGVKSKNSVFSPKNKSRLYEKWICHNRAFDNIYKYQNVSTVTFSRKSMMKQNRKKPQKLSYRTVLLIILDHRINIAFHENLWSYKQWISSFMHVEIKYDTVF